MAEGQERREVVQDRFAPTGQGVRQGSIPLAPVQTPRPSSFSQVGSESLALANALGSARNLFNKYIEKRVAEATIEGKMAFAEGVTEQEILNRGNKYTTAGFMAMKVKSEGNSWFAKASGDIEASDHQLTPDQYQDKLSQSFKDMLSSEAGDDPSTRALLAGMAENMMPKLVAKHTTAHNEFNKRNTEDSYKELLISSVEDSPEEIAELVEIGNRNFDEATQTKLLTEAITTQLASGQTNIFDIATPGAEVASDFIKLGFSKSEAVRLESARSAYKAQKSREFNTSRSKLERSILDDTSVTGNLEQAEEDIVAAINELGLDDSWASSMYAAAEREQAKWAKEQEKLETVQNAVNKNRVNHLKGKELKDALALLQKEAVDEAVASDVVQLATEETRADILHDTARANYIQKLLDNAGTVDPDLSLAMSEATTPGSVLTKDGEVTKSALDGFRDMRSMLKFGGEAMLGDHLKPGYANNLYTLANIYMESDLMTSEEDALVRAATELDTTQPLPEDIRTIQISNDEQLTDKTLKAMDNVIRPGTAVGRAFSRIFGEPISALESGDVYPDEIKAAINDPALKAEVLRRTKMHMSTMDLNTSRQAKEDVAVAQAVRGVASDATYIGGSLVLGNADRFEDSLNQVAGVIGLPGALHTGYVDLMQDLGDEFWGSDFDTSINLLTLDPSKIRDSFRAKARGVPSMRVQYHSASKNLIIHPYEDKKLGIVVPHPMIIPAEDLGRAYRLKANGDEVGYQDLLTELRSKLNIEETNE